MNKNKVSDMAKDFGMASKDILSVLSTYEDGSKKPSQVLSADEVNLIFEHLTQKHQVKIESIYAESAPKKKPEEKSASAQNQAKANSAPVPQKNNGGSRPQPQQGQQGKPAQPQQNTQPVQQQSKSTATQHPTTRVPEKKIVDTRKVTNVNLDKYDEKLQDMAERSGDRRDLERGSKEKFRNNRNRNNRQQPFSGKRKQEEAEKMRRLQLEIAKKTPLTVKIPDEISVGELASRMKKTGAEVVKCLMKNGVMASLSQMIDFDTASFVAEELGCKVEKEVVVTIEEKLIDTIAAGETKFTYTDESLILDDEPDAALESDEAGIGAMDDGLVEEDNTASSATAEYTIERSQNHANWIIRQQQSSRQYDSYSFPSAKHWLGTDKYGMDMLTRLMYGGRVSLMIGFIVIIIETVLGVILGGIAGYFGGWVDNLIMRLVDIFYCIPSMPIILILGAAMDQQRVEPSKRLIYLMLILGILGWAGIARLVRGQILSLREQEFMTATEACGISVKSRIFKHLIPNVIPQLIVNCTMGLGSVIITEATLSFLGLGVKFPFASWGNIINDVNNTHVLTTYWFIWIPAGLLLLLTVLAFNLVGDGLRDAFDPKMKR